MKRLEVVPRTLDWHAIRADFWTESAAATLVCRENAVLLRDYAATKGVTLDIEPLLAVGLDSFGGTTLWQVWAEKMGRIPRFAGSEHGPPNDALVVQCFEAEKLMVVERDVTALSAVHGGVLASFDALAPPSSDTAVVAPYGFPVEATCLPLGSRLKLFKSKKAGRPAIEGLPSYWCQVQHQILVAEAPYGWFVAAGVEDEKATAKKAVFPVIEKIPRDDRFLAAYTAAVSFYHQEFLESYLAPPMLPRDEALLRKLAEMAECNQAVSAGNFAVAVELYLAARAAELEAEERRKELEERLVQSAEAMRAEGDDTVLLADRLQIVFSRSTAPVGWQKVAKTLAERAGLLDIPKDVIAACTGKATEKVKIQEVF